MNKSYEAVSINDISKAVGMTKGALYHHFVNKEELFKSVIDKYLIINPHCVYAEDKTFYQFIEETLESTKNIVETIFDKYPNFIPVSYLSLLIDAMRHYPGFTTDKIDILDREIETIKKNMDNAVARGELRSEINTQIMSINYFSLTAGMATSILKDNTPQKALDLLRDHLHELYKVSKT